ncbi:MAG: phosphoglycerate mutase family protein [Planctomycetota bacterium]
MKTIEVRRHSIRKEGRSLSKQGFRLARKVGKQLAGHYDLAITSPKTRCRETMEAFGIKEFSEHRAFAPLDTTGLEACEEEIKKIAEREKCSTFAACFKVPAAVETLKKEAQDFLDAVCKIAKDLPDGGRALVVSHGGTIEPAALIGLKKFELAAIGGELSPCEGVAFEFEGEELSGVQVLRLKK